MVFLLLVDITFIRVCAWSMEMLIEMKKNLIVKKLQKFIVCMVPRKCESVNVKFKEWFRD